MKKRPALHRISALQALHARQDAGLTRQAEAELLGVSLRTVGGWETGASRMPYAAFKLLRVLKNGEFLDWRWSGYRIIRGKLVTPENHEFEAGDLAWLSLLVRRAAAFSELLALRDGRGGAGTRDSAATSVATALGCVVDHRVSHSKPGCDHLPARLGIVETPAKSNPPHPRGDGFKTPPPTMTLVTPPTPEGSDQRAPNRMVRGRPLHPCSNTGKILKKSVTPQRRRAGGAS